MLEIKDNISSALNVVTCCAYNSIAVNNGNLVDVIPNNCVDIGDVIPSELMCLAINDAHCCYGLFECSPTVTCICNCTYYITANCGCCFGTLCLYNNSPESPTDLVCGCIEAICGCVSSLRNHPHFIKFRNDDTLYCLSCYQFNEMKAHSLCLRAATNVGGVDKGYMFTRARADTNNYIFDRMRCSYICHYMPFVISADYVSSMSSTCVINTFTPEQYTGEFSKAIWHINAGASGNRVICPKAILDIYYCNCVTPWTYVASVNWNYGTTYSFISDVCGPTSVCLSWNPNEIGCFMCHNLSIVKEVFRK